MSMKLDPACFRVVITGSESTGKTSLATELAAFFGCPASPEAARLYVEDHPRALTVHDVEPIAQRQTELLQTAIQAGKNLVIHDTDLWSTVLYADYYYRYRSDSLCRDAEALSADLYLLCDIDLPWMPDPPFRDQGESDNRAVLHARFIEMLNRHRLSWVTISGLGEERIDLAIRTVEAACRTQGILT
jgi:nicotinamide riboside kinase